MRKILLILFTLLMFSANAELVEPDFAFPQRSLAQADSLLKSAIKHKDGMDELQALCIKTRAYAEIDRTKLVPMVDTLLLYANKQKDATTHALMTLYAATIVNEVYNGDRYAYNQREISLTTRLADMTEWSGDMFREYIDSLCNMAWEKVKKVNVKIADYNKVIEQNEISRQYYPLVRDFVVLKVMNLSGNDKIYNEWLDAQPANSKSYFNAWLKGDRSFKEVYDMYVKNANNGNAQILISALSSPYNFTDELRLSPLEVIEFYTKAKTRVSGTWLESYPLNAINSIKCPQLMLSADKSLMVPGSVKIKARYKALQGFTMNIYKGNQLSVNQQTLNKMRPIDSPYYYLRNYQYSQQDTTISLDLKDGIYYIKGDYPVAGEYQKPSGNSCISIMVSRYVPVISQTGNNLRVIVVDAVDNAPAQNVEVELTNDKKRIARRSNKKGIVTFDKLSKKPLELLVNGLPFDINQFKVQENVVSKDKNVRLVCNTELAVYHPGDTVNFVVIETLNDKVMPNDEVAVVLYDADGKEVKSTELSTDDFGRAISSFVLPDEGKTGQYCIAMSSYKTRNYKFFMVSDFKVDNYKFSDLQFWPNTPEKDKLNVRGKVLTFTGQPVANADVKVLLGDDNYSSAKSNAEGAFDIIMPLNANDDNQDEINWSLSVRAELSATLASGESLNYITYVDLPFAYTLEVTANDLLTSKFPNTKPLTCEAKIVGQDKKTKETAVNWYVCTAENNNKLVSGKSASAKFDCDLNALPAGQYIFVIQTADSTLAAPYSRNIILYNPEKDEMPGLKSNILWVEKSDLLIDESGKASSLYYINAPEAIVFFFDEDAERPENVLRYEKIKRGWHSLVYSTPGNYTLYAIDGNRRQEVSINVKTANNTGLTIVTESLRDRFDCGAVEKWSFQVVDSKNKGVPAALVLDVYNIKLDEFYNNVFSKPDFYIQSKAVNNYLITQNFFYNRELYLYASVNRLRNQSLNIPTWRFAPTQTNVMIRGRRMMAAGAVADLKGTLSETISLAKVEEAPKANFDSASAEYEDAVADLLDDVKERVEVFSALWCPNLVTDKNGRVDVPFTVPDAITQWQLKGIAWTTDGRAAKINEVFTTDKAVTVNINAPRFVRQGDKLRVAATVRNNTANVINATTIFSVGANDSLLTVEIGPKNSQDVFVWHVVNDSDSLKVSVRASTGNFADGEKITIPVLPSSFNIVESNNFYLNPADTLYTVPVPAAVGSDWSYNVDFTDNPMDLVAEALPFLDSSKLSETAICQAIAFYSCAVAIKLIEEHPHHDWKFNKEDLKKSLVRADKILVSLYDKGWRWGAWSKEPSTYVTYAVLSWLADVRHYCSPELAKCIADALPWIDSKVDAPNISYSLVRPQYNDMPMSLNAKTAIEKTMQSIVGGWRSYPLPLRAQAATALERNGYKNVADELLKSLDEYLTHTPDRGAYFANFTGIYNYPTFLTAYSTVTPESVNVDALRQYLLMRKQAQNWGEWPVTSETVYSIINSGTPWLDVEDNAHIITDNGKIAISRRGGVPAYGAVTVRYLSSADSIAAHSDGEVSVNRNIFVQRDGKWQYADTLHVGDRIKVSMTVKASRAMSNVTLTDQRPAAFAPVDQMPGYIYTDHTWAYRENRDAVSNFYIDYLPQGVSMFEYECFVTIPGRFVMGTTNVTCDLAPSLNAHSSASKISVNE